MHPTALLPAALLALPVHPAPPDLLLAEVMPPGLDPAAYLVSEKFDGVRAYWDGRALWFRGGGRIPAPAWFLERLPPVPLDGELWMGRGRFEELSGEVRREQPRDEAWRQIRYLIFELPGAPGPFEARARAIEALVARVGWPQLEAVAQTRVKDRSELQARLQAVLKAGGEGLMLHRADAPYVTGRSDALLKLKPLLDAEAVVVGHLPGKGRLAGLVGALEVETPEGRRFRIGSGLTDVLRRDPPPLGATITYTYRGLTRTGLPRFPAYLRLRTVP